MSYGTGSGQSDEYIILVIGKAGNGKSSVCNALLGDNKFAVGRGMSATTRTAQCESAVRGNMRVKVIDTPDITNTNMDAQGQREEVAKWRQWTRSKPTAVLLTVRCDVRYTAEEYDIYREIMKLWGDNSLKERLLMCFTFGDRQDMPLEEELKMVCPELKNVLRDAGQQYVAFNKTSEESRNGLMYEVVEAVQRRQRSPARGGSRWPDSPAERGHGHSHGVWPSGIAPLVLVALIVISAIGCIVSIILSATGVAIGLGVCGLVLVVVLVALVYFKQKGRGL